MSNRMQPIDVAICVCFSLRYNALVAAHYQASVLDSLPASLGSLIETHNDGTTMGSSSVASPVLSSGT